MSPPETVRLLLATHPPQGLRAWLVVGVGSGGEEDGREVGRDLADQTNGLLCKFASAYVGETKQGTEAQRG